MAEIVDRLITRLELQGEAGVVRGLLNVSNTMKGLGTLALAGGTAAFLKSSMDSARQAEDALRRYDQVQRNTGGGFPTQQAAEFASAMERISTYSDEAFLSVETMLKAAGASQGQIKGLTLAIADTAAGTGRSLEEVAQAVTRAFATGQLRGLKQYGIQVDEAAFKTDRAGALVRALEGRFKGLAEAMGNTSSGQLAKLANQFDNLKEAVGGALLPVLNQIVPMLTSMATSFIALDAATHGWSTKLLLLVGGAGVIVKLILLVKELVTGLKELAVAQAVVQALSGPKGWLTLALGLGAAAAAGAGINRLLKNAGSGGPTFDASKLAAGAAGGPNPGTAAGTGIGGIVRQFLGGGEIGRIGINATELPEMRVRAQGPITVRVEGDKTLSQLFNELLVQLTARGAIQPGPAR